MLIEKGKTRQSVCRGSDREFLAWFPQRMTKGEAIELQRGNLVVLGSELELKSNEIRLKRPSDVTERAPEEPISSF